MLEVPRVLAFSAVLAWLMIMTAALVGAKLWTPKGLLYGFGNRDQQLEKSPLAARADRAAKNMLENLVLFVALVAAAYFARAQSDQAVRLGANTFFWARLVYWFVYLAGVPYLRTAIWSVSVGGMGLIAYAAVSAH